jgi:hypothetical protein
VAQGWKCPTGTYSYKKCKIQSADIVQAVHFLQYYVYCVCVRGTLNTKWPLIGILRGLITSFTYDQRKYLCWTAHWTRWRTESGSYSTLGTCARPYTGQDGGLGVPAARGTCAGHYNKQDGGLRVEEPCGEWKGLSAPFLSLSTPIPSISNTGSIHGEEGVIHTTLVHWNWLCITHEVVQQLSWTDFVKTCRECFLSLKLNTALLFYF